MAFTLQIKQKKLFRKTILDIPLLAGTCGFKYGSNNEFYILQEEQQNNKTAIFYNPNRIGRGIFFNGTNANEGIYEISYNIPTTRAEIADFIRLAKEMGRQLGKVEIYCIEEKQKFTIEELEQGIDIFVKFNTESLNQFCQNKEYWAHILTLARWPYTIQKNKVMLWENCTDLSDFEQTLHVLQERHIYYAKPHLLQKKDTREINAFYALTEECESVFPVCADGFLNLDGIKVKKGFVQFVLYSEQRVLEGIYPYEVFTEKLQQFDIQQYDENHILIPPMSKNDLEKLAAMF